MFLVSGTLFGGMGDENKTFSIYLTSEHEANQCFRALTRLEVVGQEVENLSAEQLLRHDLLEWDVISQFDLYPLVKMVLKEQTHELGSIKMTSVTMGLSITRGALRPFETPSTN